MPSVLHRLGWMLVGAVTLFLAVVVFVSWDEDEVPTPERYRRYDPEL